MTGEKLPDNVQARIDYRRSQGKGAARYITDPFDPNYGRGKYKKSIKGKMPLYFFLNDELHRALVAHKSEDVLIAFNYKQGKRVYYRLSWARKTYQRAFRTSEVAEMMNRSVFNIYKYIWQGKVKEPQRAYPIGYSYSEKKVGKPPMYWCEKDIIDLHEYYMSLKIGRPRYDGLHFAQEDLPSRAEIRAKIRQDQMIYIKNEDGEFIPTFREQDWH